MDRDELEEYVERSMSLVEESPQMDEANTKKRLVEPFVEDVLEWDGFSDVELEYSVQMGRNPKKVDYALILEETPVVFVEAKGLDESLSEDEGKQLRSYMRQVGVNWGVLTNGERFEFLKREKGTTKPSEVTFGDLRLDELTRNEEVVQTVSKESVESGEAERIAGEIQRKKEAVSSLREKKDIIAEEVISIVTDHVDSSVASVAETEAKEFVDRVVKELENRDGKIEPDTENSGADTKKTDDVVLTAGETVVKSFSGDTQADTMAEAVDHLIRESSLSDTVSVPYVPGDTKAIINDVPRHPDGDEMRGCRQISGGFYLDTHASKEQKERRLRQLAGKCGLGVKFNW